MNDNYDGGSCRSTADVVVDGRSFDVERIGRERYSPTFIIRISVEEDTLEYPNHVFRKTVVPGGRSRLTNEYMEEKLQSWSDSHPEFTITGFGIEEALMARIGRQVDTDS